VRKTGVGKGKETALKVYNERREAKRSAKKEGEETEKD